MRTFASRAEIKMISRSRSERESWSAWNALSDRAQTSACVKCLCIHLRLFGLVCRPRPPAVGVFISLLPSPVSFFLLTTLTFHFTARADSQISRICVFFPQAQMISCAIAVINHTRARGKCLLFENVRLMNWRMAEWSEGLDVIAFHCDNAHPIRGCNFCALKLMSAESAFSSVQLKTLFFCGCFKQLWLTIKCCMKIWY